MGIEEATSWEKGTTENQVIAEIGGREFSEGDEDPSKAWQNVDKRTEGAPVREKTSKIVAPLSRSYASTDWRAYRDEKLWTPGSQVCQVNLWPLGKPKTVDWPNWYAELFGFSRGQNKEYKRYVQEIRHPALRQRWSGSGAQAVVCFGFSEWPAFRSAFQLSGEGREIVKDKVQWYPNERVVLCAFLGNGQMSDDHLARVTETLRKAGVSIS